MSYEVVRADASGKCHVADVPDSLRYSIEIMGSKGEAVEAPVATVCRTVLKSEPVVVMTKAKVGCRPCALISGIKRTPLLAEEPK